MEYYVCMIACVRIWHVMNVCMYVRAQCVCVYVACDECVYVCTCLVCVCVCVWHVMNVCMYVRAQCVCVRTVWHFTVHYYYAVSMQATVNEVYYTLIHFRNLK